MKLNKYQKLIASILLFFLSTMCYNVYAVVPTQITLSPEEGIQLYSNYYVNSIFSDLDDNHWAIFYIQELYDKNIIAGDGDGNFRPDDSVSIAELLKMTILLAEVEPPNNSTWDNDGIGHWARKYIEYACNKFGTDPFFQNGLSDSAAYSPAKRELACFVIWEILMSNDCNSDVFLNKYNISENDLNIFVDKNSISTERKESVAELFLNDVVVGYPNGLFEPLSTLTRAECCKILSKCINPKTPEAIGKDIESTLFDSFDNITADGTSYYLTTNEYNGAACKFTVNETGIYNVEITENSEYEPSVGIYVQTSTNNGIQYKLLKEETLGSGQYLIGKDSVIAIVIYNEKNTSHQVRVSKSSDIEVNSSVLEYTKETDRNYIYINNPEYLTRFDMIDGPRDNTVSKWFGKIFEQENVTGKNTYYQTHLAWECNELETYDPESSFYIDVDFYNPTSDNITISISKLSYGYDPDVLESYLEGWGPNKTAIIPPGKHWRLLGNHHPSYIYDQDVLPDGFHRDVSGDGWEVQYINGDQKKIFIMFDFEVVGNNGVIISSIAAYNESYLDMDDNLPRTVHLNNNTVISLGYGEIREKNHRRSEIFFNKNELLDKHKGIALGQANQVDANLNFIIDNSIINGNNLKIKLKDTSIGLAEGASRDRWYNNVNPINDDYNARYYTPPSNLHTFEYRYSDNQKWIFSPLYQNTNGINTQQTIVSNPVSTESINELISKLSVDSSQIMSHGTPIDSDAIGMGAWGTVYHYHVTFTNLCDFPRKIEFYVLGPNNTFFGFKKLEGYSVDFYEYISKSNPRDLMNWTIEAYETHVIDVITLSAVGAGGQEYYFMMIN